MDLAGPVDAIDESLPAWLQKLGHRHVLVRARDGQFEDSIWLERQVKPAAVSALRHAIHDSAPSPVDDANQQNLLRQASALTNDPLELVTLLEGALEDGDRQASPDHPSAEDYRRSLEVVAGARLGERLTRLGGEARREAVNLVLSGGAGDPYDSSFRRGANALQSVGLATYRNGGIALGPLARAAATVGRIRDTLIERMPRDAWSTRAAVWVERERGTSVSAAAAGPGIFNERVDALILSVLAVEHEAVLSAAGVRGTESELVTSVKTYGRRTTKPLHIVMARLRELGGFVSVQVAKEMIRAVRPSVVAMCGICTGVRGKVAVGDVIVADAVVRYDRLTEDVRAESHLASEFVYRLGARWRDRVFDFRDRSGAIEGRVHVGGLATGMQALREPSVTHQPSIARREVLGIELETEALHVIAGEDGVVVRGVSNLADDAKSTGSQVDAARAAAAWLMAFLREELDAST